MIISDSDKKFTIIKIQTTAPNTTFSFDLGEIYWWGENDRITTPATNGGSHTFAEPGEYLIYIGGVKYTYSLTSIYPNLTLSGFKISENTDKKMVIEVLNFGTSCTTLYKSFYNCTKLTKISNFIPDGYIDMSSAFENCNSLKQTPQKIANSVIYMRTTFKSTAIEKTCKLPKSVVDIYGCFWGCRNLMSAPDFPDSVKIAGYCFASCSSLLYPPKINDKCTQINNVFDSCSNLTEMPDIPDGILNINHAFKFTAIMKTKKLHNNIKEMQNAFQGCSKLISIENIPASLTDMSYAFTSCSSLEKINLDYNDFPLCYKFNSTFEGCTKLKNSITGKPTRLDLAKKMYYGCVNLEIISDAHTVMNEASAPTNELDMYCHCNNIKYMNEQPLTIYDLPLYLNGIGNRIVFKISIPSDNYTVSVASGSVYSWGTIKGSSTKTTKSYPKGEYILMMDLVDYTAMINEKEVIKEILYIPTTYMLYEAFEDCINLEKCCSLAKNTTSISLSYTFRNCKKLKTPPQVSDIIQDMVETFFNTGITSICNIPSEGTRLKHTFRNCHGLTEVNFVSGPNIQSVESIFEGCLNLNKLTMDLTKVTQDKFTLCNIVGECRNLKHKNFKINLPQNKIISLAKIFSNYDENHALYAMPQIPKQNIGPCFGMYGNGEEIVLLGRQVYKPYYEMGYITKEVYLQQLQYIKNTSVPYPSKVNKCYNLWEYYKELETKEDTSLGTLFKYSEGVFTGNREIRKFVDYVTGKETFGSYGLIPEIWGGAYSKNKNVIGVRVQANTTIRFVKDSNVEIDSGDCTTLPTRDSSITYTDAGKYFITSEGDFDIVDEDCKYVVEICNLIPNSVMGKKGMIRFKNLTYCYAVQNNDNGDYSDYFNGCHRLVNSPAIPSNAINCDRMFQNTNIKVAPTIPVGVKTCESIFDECKELTSDTQIPNTVLNCRFAFRNCFAIKNIVNTFAPGKSADCKYNNCYSGVSIDIIPDDWK